MKSRNWRRPIGEILVDKGLLTKEQLTEALALQASEQPRRKIGEILIGLGYVGKKDVLRAHAEQLGCMYEGGLDTD